MLQMLQTLQQLRLCACMQPWLHSELLHHILEGSWFSRFMGQQKGHKGRKCLKISLVMQCMLL